MSRFFLRTEVRSCIISGMKNGEKERHLVAMIRSRSAAGRAELRGVSDATSRLGWTLEVIDDTIVGRELGPFLPVLAKADGIIARTGDSLEDGTLSRLGVPLVGIDVMPPESRMLWASLRLVEHKVGELAAEELLATGRRHLAFVPMLRRYSWTTERGKAFVARVKAAGCQAHFYKPKTEWGWAEERAALSRWLAALPRPFGVFAGNDLLARLVLGACLDAGLSVPEDAAVLGADDDESICLSSSPTLSSIRVDFEGAGRKAVEVMRSLIGCPRPARTLKVLYNPLDVSRRASTRTADTAIDTRVLAAQDFIALHASDPTIGVADVARVMFVCRRQADRLFRATGKSIREHIEDVRIEHVKALLRSGGKDASEIAAACGFTSASYLSFAFRRKTGSTLRDWHP